MRRVETSWGCRGRANGHGAAGFRAAHRQESVAHAQSRRCNESGAMIAARIVALEASKLAMIPAIADMTLLDDLAVADADEDDLYEAMDWLLQR